MDRKALQLAISTIILIALGVLVLVLIVYAVMGGFKKYESSTGSFLDMAQAASVRETCSFACENNVKMSYCCTEHEIDGEMITCDDGRLEVSCAGITCEEGFCEAQ